MAGTVAMIGAARMTASVVDETVEIEILETIEIGTITEKMKIATRRIPMNIDKIQIGRNFMVPIVRNLNYLIILYVVVKTDFQGNLSNLRLTN